MASKRAQIADDYHNSGLSVRQIASKYGVCVRTVYNAISGKANRKNQRKPERKAIYLSKEETETLLLCISESEKLLSQSKTVLISGIENRLLNIADELTY